MPSSRLGEANRAEGKACSPSHCWVEFHASATVISERSFEVRVVIVFDSGRSFNESGAKKRSFFSGGAGLAGPTETAIKGTVTLCGCGVRRSASFRAKSRGLDDRSAPNKYSKPGNIPQLLASPTVPSPT